MMKKWLVGLGVLVGAVVLMLAGMAIKAEALVIDSFDSTGRLTFAEITNAASYRVAWSATPSGPWTNALHLIPAMGSGSVTSTVPIFPVSAFYRVVASLPSVPVGMVLIPGGTNSGTDPDFGAYSLTIESFYMDKYQTTKALWDEVHNWAIANGYSFDNAGSGKAHNHPVHTVNWYDVVKWCNARSQMEGRTPVYTVNGAVYKTGQHDNVVQTSAAGYRLPTNTEWEYAARGGLTSRRFPWGDTINHNHANYRANGSAYSYDTSPYTTRTYHPTYNDGTMPYTSPVGSFAENGYGLHDMAGNVWQWIFDWHPSYVGSYRVLRGGSYAHDAYGCRVGSHDAYRPGHDWPDSAFSNYGFRAVLPPGPADAP